MEKPIKIWQLFNAAIVTLLGTLLHFLYGLTGDCAWVAPFSAVNESTFEHMKILFFPMLLFAIIEGFFFRDNKAFWCIKLKGTLLGLILIPILFYTYNGVIGPSPDFVNITIFFLSAGISAIYEARRLQRDNPRCILPPWCAKLGFLLLAAAFALFTFYTPEINLFLDPLTLSYGIRG